MFSVVLILGSFPILADLGNLFLFSHALHKCFRWNNFKILLYFKGLFLKNFLPHSLEHKVFEGRHFVLSTILPLVTKVSSSI